MKFVAVEKTSLAGFGLACTVVGASSVAALGALASVGSKKRSDSLSALAAWHHSFLGPTIASTLSVASGACFLATARSSSKPELWFLPMAAALLSAVPDLALQTESKLANIPLEAAGEATDALIGTWGKTQCAKAGLGLVAVAGCLYAICSKGV